MQTQALKSNIIDLSPYEIFAVFGAADPPPPCPSGYHVISATYDKGGNLTSYTCAPNEVRKFTEETFGAANEVIKFVKTAAGWISSVL
jgi:hypothetical protein